MRRPYRACSLYVTGRDGPLRNAAGLGVEAIQIALDACRYSGSRGSRRGWNAVEPLEALGCNLLRRPLVLALIGVGLLPRGDLEQCQQEVFPRRGVAFIQRFVVPAALAVAAGRDAGLLDDMRPGLARGVGNREGIFDGDDIVVVEHGAASLALENDQAMPAEQGRNLLEDVAHGGVAVAVELVLAALSDDVHLGHDGGDGADTAAPRDARRQCCD